MYTGKYVIYESEWAWQCFFRQDTHDSPLKIKLVNWASFVSKTLPAEWKEKPCTGKSYLQSICLIKYSYPKYITTLNKILR